MQEKEHGVEIRDARDEDIPSITAIYNDAVENTTAIWNERIVDESNRRQWLAERTAAGFPVLVAVETHTDSSDRSEHVLGYASYTQFRPFDGYRHTVEHSVYVDSGGRGRGTGRTLMEALVERARRERIHAMIAGVDAENAASLALHENLGFRAVGRLDQVGTKFGRWLDLAFLQLTLDSEQLPPR